MIYDEFQKKAIAAIDQEKSVLVSAPTGAGKTAIAEYAIEKALARQERVIYTAPIKALSNQKYRDFSLRYPELVGILTGDVSLNPGAPILIMTTEIYRNRLFEDPQQLESTTWVIFDEVHYLDDRERGTVWEEAMMFSPAHVRFVALSATAPNIEELATWIRNILGHPIEVIIEKNRPVPLQHLFQCQGQVYADPVILKKQGYLNRDSWSLGRQSRRQRFSRGRHFGRQQAAHDMLHAKPNRLDDLIRHLAKESRLPCLYFCFGRRRTEELAWECIKFDFLSPDDRTAILDLYQKLCERFDLLKEHSAIRMRGLVEKGVAFHHAGMLPTLKEVVEQLFTSKLIRLIFTTETFALGINMPAKSVVFDELRKFYGTHFGFLRTRDYFQMAGRAGRRGIDLLGFVYSRVNPHNIPHSILTRVIYGNPESIESQFNSCYATVLNLYARFGSKLLEVYPRSLHYFQSSKKDRQRGADSLEKKIALLRELGCIRGEALSQKGEFASWMYGYELLLAQMLEGGTLDALNETKLSVLLCSLVFEPRKNEPAPRVPPHLKELNRCSFEYLRHIHGLEARYKISPESKIPYFHLAAAMEAWIGGCTFAELAHHTEIDEGEIIRYFRMTIQLLRQLRQAPQVSPRLRQTAANAQKKIDRDLVDAEKQLKNR